MSVVTLSAYPVPMRERIDREIVAFAADPRPRGCAKLAGQENLYRIRVGSYRILYEIYDSRNLVRGGRCPPPGIVARAMTRFGYVSKVPRRQHFLFSAIMPFPHA
ncbi:MAG: hypothetical protein ABIP55_02075 [Tepidisphaeraceae bacterium]